MTQPAEPTPDAVSDEAIEWYVLMRSGVAGERERRRFAEWLAADPRHAHAYAEAGRLWAQMCSAARQGDRTRIAPRRMGWSRRMPLGIAAAALLAAVVVLHGGHPLDAWLSDHHSGVGEQREVSLPDGTAVLLDTDSAISLDFGKTERRVRLDRGRALFTATADPGRPFEVRTATLIARALGTVFEVSATSDEETRVAVMEHAVEVRDLEGGDAVHHGRSLAMVEAGQQLRVGARAAIGAPEPADLEVAGAWRRQKLIVKDQPLAQIIAEIDRYRPGQIMIPDPGLRARRITGVFPLNDPDGALHAIEQALELRVVETVPWLVFLLPA